ncbi:MAG: formate--tetrahydrofolate ligase, partial [Candidatus Methanomethylophilaceae archaeon]|nr:formate--tetrahydrofolate ligase [Candidatus Methanomethylophilaceae archaeon]
IHAVAAAHNLLSALVENHIARGNELNLDPSQITLKKTMDMNCRELRNIVVGLGDTKLSGGVTHQSGFLITSASEVSAILALSKDRKDLRERLGRIVVGYTYDGKAVTAKDIGAVGSMMVILKDAINPNLVQTLEGVPVFIHGFPFANIAHGANSIIATRAAMSLSDITVTEAGFAADLGAEKFMDIVCRQGGISPDCVVIVATIKALMTHGGGVLEDESTLTMESLEKGLCNLDKHIENMSYYGVPIVVAINHFAQDKPEEIEFIRKHCVDKGVSVAFSDGFIDGGKGAEEIAKAVIDAVERPKDFKYLYGLDSTVKEKIETVAKKIYGADGVVYSAAAEKAIANIVANGYGGLPVCIAKTQASLTDDSKMKGAPKGWKLNVREVWLSAGAGFIVPVCGTLTLMPGLPKVPAAMRIDLNPDGTIVGLK